MGQGEGEEGSGEPDSKVGPLYAVVITVLWIWSYGDLVLLHAESTGVFPTGSGEEAEQGEGSRGQDGSLRRLPWLPGKPRSPILHCIECHLECSYHSL